MKNIVIFCLFSVLTIFAQSPNLGTSGAKFLQIPVDARSTGLANAITADVSDASAGFWNPAGLAHVKSVDVQFSYFRWFDLFDMNAIAAAYNMGEAGVLGVNFISFTSGRIEITTEKEQNGTGRFYDSQDMAVALSYSRFLTDRFSFGANVKYVYQRIWNETADGIAFDVGTQYRIDWQNLTIAMSMSNFGPNLKFAGPDLNITYLKDKNFPDSRLAPGQLATEEFPLPLNFQVGVGLDLYTDQFVKVRGAVDVQHPNDNNERINSGVEFGFFDRFFVRGGYKYNYDVEKYGFGAGANLPLESLILRVDYSYAVYDILPDVQRITFGFSF